MEGTCLGSVPTGDSLGTAQASGQGSQHSTVVWGEILTILGFLPEQFN